MNIYYQLNVGSKGLAAMLSFLFDNSLIYFFGLTTGGGYYSCYSD